MKKVKLLLASFLLSMYSFFAYSQEHGHSSHHNAHSEKPEENIHFEHGKHKIAAYGGFTHISAAFYNHETEEESTGKWVPTFGVEYYYKLNKYFDLGMIADVETDSYYIRTSSEEELERNNVFIVAAVLRYTPIKRLGLFLGPGYETEFVGQPNTTSFFVAKLGIDYEVEIENGWELSPIFSYDIKEKYSAYSFGVSLGKRF